MSQRSKFLAIRPRSFARDAGREQADGRCGSCRDTANRIDPEQIAEL